ncbi:MAG: ferredoxin--NADP reductase [Catalinimonas sp.]
MFKQFKQLFTGKSNQPLELPVKEVVRETPDAISIHFEAPAGLTYRSGQFLTLIIDLNGEEVRRSYSLSSSPHTDADWVVSVKRVDGGQVSNYLNDQLRAGDRLRVLPPSGQFTIDESTTPRHVVLFGGGSGITPLISLAKTLLHREPESQVSLVYANRDVDSIIFQARIHKLCDEHPHRFQVAHVLETHPGPSHESLAQAYAGRIDATVLADAFEQMPPRPAGTEYFVCGPEGMMQTVIAQLQELGVPKEQIRKESFVVTVDEDARQEAYETAAGGGGETHRVTVRYDGEEHAFEVKPDQTILDAALDLDLDLPYSCQSGLCTACRGRCLSGKVHLDEMEGLSQRELDEGYVLTCVGRPLTDDVVIEIG